MTNYEKKRATRTILAGVLKHGKEAQDRSQ